MWARLRTRPLEAALALSCALHVAGLIALLCDVPRPRESDLASLPPMEVVLAHQPAPMIEKTISQRGTAARASIELPLADTAPPSPAEPHAGNPAPAGQNNALLGAALRGSSVACPLLGGVFTDRAARVRCNDRLGANLARTRWLGGIRPEKAVLYDEMAFEQEEARAFSFRPTASTVRPAGAGEIAGGPASDEIFAHNVGDPSPPKDPLLRREARRLGPALP